MPPKSIIIFDTVQRKKNKNTKKCQPLQALVGAEVAIHKGKDKKAAYSMTKDSKNKYDFFSGKLAEDVKEDFRIYWPTFY